MRRRRAVLALAGSWTFLAAPAAYAQLTTLQNDSFTGGAFTCVQGFAETETMAARFTAPPGLYPYTIDRIHVLTCGGDALYAVDVWQDDGPGPNPGTLLWTSGVNVYQLDGDNAFHEIVLPQPVTVLSGTVRVGLFQSLATAGFPGFGRDNGITSQRNLIHANDGNWYFAETFLIAGDFVLRALVRPDTLFKNGFE
jgi:hypothetical protein